MNDRFEAVNDDPYETFPLGPVFIAAALDAHESSGSPRIPDQRARELRGAFGLTEGETAAHVYLAGMRAHELLVGLEVDTTFGLIAEE